jgi:hypothetical protein
MSFFGNQANQCVYEGSFEDLRVYNRLVSEEEIAALAGK